MVDCAGIWCRLEDEKEGENNDRRGRDDDDDGGYGRMADGWGTIHMIIGMGGRRGDQCPALVRALCAAALSSVFPARFRRVLMG